MSDYWHSIQEVFLFYCGQAISHFLFYQVEHFWIYVEVSIHLDLSFVYGNRYGFICNLLHAYTIPASFVEDTLHFPLYDFGFYVENSIDPRICFDDNIILFFIIVDIHLKSEMVMLLKILLLCNIVLVIFCFSYDIEHCSILHTVLPCPAEIQGEVISFTPTLYTVFLKISMGSLSFTEKKWRRTE